MMLRRKILNRNIRAEKSLPAIVEGESQNDQNLSRSDNAKDMKRFSLSSIFMNGSTTDSTLENYLHTINEDSEDKNPSLENSNDDDSISTVSHSLEFNNDSSNLSLASQSEQPSVNDLRSFSRPFSIVFHDDDDDDELSYSSVNTEAFKQIRDLKNKLSVQENTKIHLINQLQQKMSSSEKAMLVNYIKSLKKENHKLVEGVAKMEHEYMNNLCKLETVIEKKDEKIAKLEKKMAQLEAKLKEEDNSTTS